MSMYQTRSAHKINMYNTTYSVLVLYNTKRCVFEYHSQRFVFETKYRTLYIITLEYVCI